LESNGIDVILGMDWLSRHKVLIDCAKKSIKLTTPDGNELEYIAELVVESTEVPMVNEFHDVFPKELLGMPPDWYIEFVIKLVAGTTPIYKRPYSMAAKQLAELKDQIKELLEKGYICSSSSPSGAPVIFISKKDGT
jgi:hypothetical protein